MPAPESREVFAENPEEGVKGRAVYARQRYVQRDNQIEHIGNLEYTIP
jgi:hypothetical protein